MDKLDIQDSGSSLTPDPVPNPEVPNIDQICEAMNRYMNNTAFSKEWSYGKMFGKDAVFAPRKVIEDVTNIVLDDMKENPGYNDVMSASNRQKVSQAINMLLSTYQSPAVNIEDSKKITTKLLGYFLSLHVLQNSV